MRLRVLIAAVAAPLVLWAVLPLGSQGAPSAGRLGAKIETKRDAIARNKSRDQVLSTDIAAYSGRIRNLQGDIGRLQRRQAFVEADLARKRAELAQIQEDLRYQRARLAKLRARLATAQRVLSTRLVELYKTDDPDVVTVVLESDGFAELLERAEFIGRVNDEDARVIGVVRAARRDAAGTTRRLFVLQRRQTRLTAIVLSRRNEIAANKRILQVRRDSAARARDGRAAVLAGVRSRRRGLMEEDRKSVV